MTDLITLEEYKESQGMTNVKDDARLDVLVKSVSQLVKTYCNRTFIDNHDTDKTQYFSVDEDTDSLALSEFPVISITSIEERSSYSEAYVLRTAAAFEYYVDLNTDSVLRTNKSTGYLNWSRGPGSVKIVYKAGYAETPEDLKLAIYDLITYYYKDEHKKQKTLQGSTISNSGTSSQVNQATFPDHIKRVLDLYRDRR